MFQSYDFPKEFTVFIEERLKAVGHSLDEPEKLAKSVLELSNFFIKAEFGADYWQKPEYVAAYLSYFSTLNFVRARAVVQEAVERGFLFGAKKVIDVGCGAGAASWALAHQWGKQAQATITGTDRSEVAIKEYASSGEALGYSMLARKFSLKQLHRFDADTLLMSYALNEVEQWPVIPPQIKRMIIIEPSSHQAGRHMLHWRNQLVSGGWHVWAPCTHQAPCPLLVHSSKDWCHHRVHWTQPDWFQALEQNLPMKNKTITVSYVLLSKEAPTEDLSRVTRVIGDMQEENGKTKQAVCRGPDREFLSWLHRSKIELELHRGEMIKIDGPVIKGDELRISSQDSVSRYKKR